MKQLHALLNLFTIITVNSINRKEHNVCNGIGNIRLKLLKKEKIVPLHLLHLVVVKFYWKIYCNPCNISSQYHP